MTIYAVVRSGFQDDEVALGVFVNKKRAERYCEKVNEEYAYKPYFVEEWYLDEGDENDEIDV